MCYQIHFKNSLYLPQGDLESFKAYSNLHSEKMFKSSFISSYCAQFGVFRVDCEKIRALLLVAV